MVRQHARLVYRIVYGVLRNHHEAEDATQETFVRVLRYGKKLGKVEDHKSWLARIAWRIAVDRSRQHSRKREIPLESFDHPFEELGSSELGAEEAILGEQVGAQLEKLVAALTEKVRAPLVLAAVGEVRIVGGVWWWGRAGGTPRVVWVERAPAGVKRGGQDGPLLAGDGRNPPPLISSARRKQTNRDRRRQPTVAAGPKLEQFPSP